MDQQQKDQLLTEAKKHIREITDEISVEIPNTEEDITRLTRELLSARLFDEKVVKRNMLELTARKLGYLQSALDSPYFSRCDIKRDGERKSVYFGKFSLPEFDIYSWVAPAAKLRFEQPGEFVYMNEGGKEVQGRLSRNDQYLIANTHINFMATASEGQPRTLIYQEHFSGRKSAFILPEIVERMEKAQDEIVRADPEGSFLISGPAGSGKTTLALHRIAYLLQAPETAARFKAKDVLVLVQDESTRYYFDQLLPSLGIKDVKITTFPEWAKEMLSLPDFRYQANYGRNENERDTYALHKQKAAVDKNFAPPSSRSPFLWLEKLYSHHFPAEALAVFRRQKKDKVLDRFDLTVLLRDRLRTKGAFFQEEKVYDETVVGIARYKWVASPTQYSLILLDEFQNYLPEQIRIVRSCISPKTNAMTYVGDLAQQTNLFSLRSWDMVGESFEEGRAITLDKVYRSTRQILEYLRSVGFLVQIPKGLREGEEPQEKIGPLSSWPDEIKRVTEANPNVLIGIIGIEPENVSKFKSFETDNVKVMTVTEAQGVEFDVVIFLNQNLELGPAYPAEIRDEKRKVLRDQLYVGLTRAMNGLYVLGEGPLKKVLSLLSSP